MTHHIDKALAWNAARLLDYAQAHHYFPGPGVPAPEDDPALSMRLQYNSHTYRCVFYYVWASRKIFRHLLITADAPGALVPDLVYCAARLFGIKDWRVEAENDVATIITQRITQDARR